MAMCKREEYSASENPVQRRKISNEETNCTGNGDREGNGTATIRKTKPKGRQITGTQTGGLATAKIERAEATKMRGKVKRRRRSMGRRNRMRTKRRTRTRNQGTLFV